MTRLWNDQPVAKHKGANLVLATDSRLFLAIFFIQGLQRGLESHCRVLRMIVYANRKTVATD